MVLCAPLVVLVYLLCFTEETPPSSSNVMHSSLEYLHRRLDESNTLLNEILRDYEDPTANEPDLDYIMDGEVRRAWARNQFTKHKEERDTNLIILANKNVENVLRNAQCREPLRRCLNVNELTDKTSKKYWPNCALVYRCGADAGCCSTPGHTCTVIESNVIGLHFFVLDFEESKRGGVDYMTFTNHTICGCRPINDGYEPCSCPADFDPILLGRDCKCDCKNHEDKKCSRIKKGKRSYPSRKCKKCGPPICEYGEYLHEFNRCPRKRTIKAKMMFQRHHLFTSTSRKGKPASEGNESSSSFPSPPLLSHPPLLRLFQSV